MGCAVIRRAIIALVVSAVPLHTTPHTVTIHTVAPKVVHHQHHLVSRAVMQAWHRVYVCETHNWKQQGHYAGGLGITLWNWQHHGGLRFASAPWLATPEQQVYVATLIQHGLPVPDQTNDCENW